MNYIQSNINKIILGDCHKILPSFPIDIFDCIITSPPYNLGGNFHSNKISYGSYDNFEDNLDENDYQNQQIVMLNECYRVSKQNAVMFYVHKLRKVKGLEISPLEWILKSNWKIYQTIVLDQKATANIDKRRCFPIYEFLFVLVKNNQIKLNNKYGYTDIWEIKKRSRKTIKHPATFSEDLVRRCLRLATKKGDLVLDCYAGIGTTLFICKLLQRKCIAIEISPTYVDIINKKLNSSIEKWF